MKKESYQNKTRETTRINYYERDNVLQYIRDNNKSITQFVRRATSELMKRELKAK